MESKMSASGTEACIVRPSRVPVLFRANRQDRKDTKVGGPLTILKSMRKVVVTFLFIFCSFLSPSTVYAEETSLDIYDEVSDVNPIYLDSSVLPSSISNTEQKLYKFDKIEGLDNLSQSPMRYHHSDDNAKSNLTHTYSKKIKNSTYGTKLDSTMTSDTAKQSVTLFKKYEKNKFSIDTYYQNTDPANFAQQTSGTVSVAPGMKINNNLSVKNVFSSDLQKDQKKGEVVLSVQPLKTDRMNLDLGAGQVLDTNNAITRTQLNFSTKFRF